MRKLLLTCSSSGITRVTLMSGLTSAIACSQRSIETEGSRRRMHDHRSQQHRAALDVLDDASS
jgi:hypothetical protein